MEWPWYGVCFLAGNCSNSALCLMNISLVKYDDISCYLLYKVMITSWCLVLPTSWYEWSVNDMCTSMNVIVGLIVSKQPEGRAGSIANESASQPGGEWSSGESLHACIASLPASQPTTQHAWGKGVVRPCSIASAIQSYPNIQLVITHLTLSYLVLLVTLYSEIILQLFKVSHIQSIRLKMSYIVSSKKLNFS